jgi:tetratricopeptide (TPR) repeat protein
MKKIHPFPRPSVWPVINLQALEDFKDILSAFDACFGIFSIIMSGLALVAALTHQSNWRTFLLLIGFALLNLTLTQISNRVKNRFKLEIFRLFFANAILLIFTFLYSDGLFRNYWPGFLVISLASGAFFTASMKKRTLAYLQIGYWVGLLSVGNFFFSQTPLNWVSFTLICGIITMSTAVLIEVTQVFNVSIDKIKQMKNQQDGDYYLTSLLIKPLINNWNKSEVVSAAYYIEQKKKFSFKDRHAEIGGDICICGNLLFGDESEKWVFFLNADAMGKSMQGAGGAIVAGTAMNNILSRYAKQESIIRISPRDWIEQTYTELDSIFRTFDGVMMASAVLGLIHEESGKMLYFNAEHPWSALYRNGQASFLENELTIRKLGCPTDLTFRVLEAQLLPDDIVYIGSDGRDDINMSHDGVTWEINADETFFLRTIEEAKGDLSNVVRKLHESGTLSDDLSLIRIGFREGIGKSIQLTGETEMHHEIRQLRRAKLLVQENDSSSAIAILTITMQENPRFSAGAKLLGKIYYEKGDYEQAIHWLKIFLNLKPDVWDYWFLISLCYKRIRNFTDAISAAEKVREYQPFRVANIINLADAYRLIGKFSEAKTVLAAAAELDGSNPKVQQLAKILNTDRTMLNR